MRGKGTPTHTPKSRRARRLQDENELLESVSGGETDLEAQKQQQQAAQTRFTYVTLINTHVVHKEKEPIFLQ